jgi:hypothetical protein
MVIWLYFHAWPALAELGTWRSSFSPDLDQLSLKRPQSTLNPWENDGKDLKWGGFHRRHTGKTAHRKD